MPSSPKFTRLEAMDLFLHLVRTKIRSETLKLRHVAKNGIPRVCYKSEQRAGAAPAVSQAMYTHHHGLNKGAARFGHRHHLPVTYILFSLGTDFPEPSDC